MGAVLKPMQQCKTFGMYLSDILQIWTCVFAAVAKSRESAAKGSLLGRERSERALLGNDNFEQPPYSDMLSFMAFTGRLILAAQLLDSLQADPNFPAKSRLIIIAGRFCTSSEFLHTSLASSHPATHQLHPSRTRDD